MKFPIPMLAFSLVLAASAVVWSGSAEADCLLKYREVLMSGGFSGLTDCDHNQIAVREVGTIAIHKHEYTVLDYRYKAAPTPGGSVHGGQRVLIIDDGHYIGQYALSPPPLRSMTVTTMSIIVDVPAANGREIKFT